VRYRRSAAASRPLMGAQGEQLYQVVDDVAVLHNLKAGRRDVPPETARSLSCRASDDPRCCGLLSMSSASPSSM
jgi:hypothetical protein